MMTLLQVATSAEFRTELGFGDGRKLKATISICPVCLSHIAAEVFDRAGEVWMDKTCQAHGSFSALLASNSKHYFLANNAPRRSENSASGRNSSRSGDDSA